MKKKYFPPMTDTLCVECSPLLAGSPTTDKDKEDINIQPGSGSDSGDGFIWGGETKDDSSYSPW